MTYLTPIPTADPDEARYALQVLDLDGFLAKILYLRHRSRDGASHDLSVYACERLAIGETVRLVDLVAGKIVSGESLLRSA